MFTPTSRAAVAHCIAIVCVATTVAPATARAEKLGSNSNNSSQGSIGGGGSSTDEDVVSTVLGMTAVATTIGLGIGGYAITKSANRRAAVAEIYLRQHAVELRQELCLGRGPILSRFAATLMTDKRQRRTFTSAVHKRRFVLLALAAPTKLTTERALQFFRVLRVAQLQALSSSKRTHATAPASSPLPAKKLAQPLPRRGRGGGAR